jgi:trehalose 6-phosphate phosphatase
MSVHPPLLTQRSALFLDFDGTLAELAPRPDAIVVPDELPSLLQRLHDQLGGALAIVTGRAQADIEPFLVPLQLPCAFEHGAIRRNAQQQLSVAETPGLDEVLAAAQALADLHSGLLVERKRSSMALHFRLAPHLEDACVHTLEEAIQRVPGLQLLRGKAVVEAKSTQVGKGLAIDAFLAETPFAGRVPVFAGDDVTDEPGFASVQRQGGTGIKIGQGDSIARHRISDPQALRQWLHQSASSLP